MSGVPLKVYLPGYREVIVLREFENMSYQQMSEILDCPTGTVMSRLGRAREKLKTLLQEWNSEDRVAAKAAAG